MIDKKLDADWWRVLGARAVIAIWGLLVAFTLPFDAAGPLGPAQRCALGAGLAALLAGGVGTAHWGVTASLGAVVLCGAGLIAGVLLTQRQITK